MSIPLQIIEIPEHFRTTAKPATLSRRYRVVGTDNQSLVNAYCIGATPALQATIYGILYRQDLQIEQDGYNQWSVEVPYATRKNEVGNWTWSFDTTGASVHIKVAKQELRRYARSGQTAPNQFGVIGVDGDDVLGTDIVIPAMKMDVTYTHPLGQISLNYAKYLSNITGSTNSDSFLTFRPGEVLYLGSRGSDGTEAEASVTYSFAMSANETVTIGDITNVVKNGWEYLWVKYEDAVETGGSSNYPIRRPKFVYIDRVYPQIAMAASLGFGG